MDGECNWEKALMMGNRIKEFVALNGNSYSFPPSLPIQSALFFGEVLEVIFYKTPTFHKTNKSSNTDI